MTSGPDPPPVLRLRKREVDDEVEPADERVVDVALVVGRQDHRAGVGLHALEQVGDLDVGVAVVGVRDLRALAEQRVGLVEEQDRVGPVGGAEDALEVLLGLPDVLRDDGGEVDAEEVQPELGAEHLRAHRLARPRLAREQHLQPLRAGDGALVAPVREHAIAVAQVGGDRPQEHALALGHHQVLPAIRGVEPRRQLPHARHRRVARAPVELGLVGRGDAARAGGDAAHLGRGGDLVDREAELGRDVARVLHAAELGPRALALAERRERHVDEQHGAIPQRQRLRARVAEHDDALLGLVDRRRACARDPAGRGRRARRCRAGAPPARRPASRPPSRPPARARRRRPPAAARPPPRRSPPRPARRPSAPAASPRRAGARPPRPLRGDRRATAAGRRAAAPRARRPRPARRRRRAGTPRAGRRP